MTCVAGARGRWLEAQSSNSYPRLLSSFRARILIVLGAFIIAGCSRGGPPLPLYVLGNAPPAVASTTPQAGLPVIEVKPVKVPDYIDTTDLLVRSGVEMVPSRAGRWGERLSVGTTRALATALAARLPRMAVTMTAPVQPPARQVIVDLGSFEARADGNVVLVARWSILDGTGRKVLAMQRVSLVEPVAGTGDAGVIAAMTRAIEDLAGGIAARIDRSFAVSGGLGVTVRSIAYSGSERSKASLQAPEIARLSWASRA